MSSRKSWILAASTLVLMTGTALLLRQFQVGHRLGPPGLKLCDIRLVDENGQQATTNSIGFPERVLDFESRLMPVTQEELNWLPRDTTFGRRLYQAPDGFWAQVTGVLMGTDRTSIHKPEYCLPGQGFQITRRSRLAVPIERPHRYALPVMRLDAIRETKAPDGRVTRTGAVYVYWFLSDTRLSNDHLQRMWWLASDLLRTGELQRWAYIGCLAYCPPGGEDAAYLRVQQLVQALVPEFQSTTGPAAGIAETATASPISQANIPSEAWPTKR